MVCSVSNSSPYSEMVPIGTGQGPTFRKNRDHIGTKLRIIFKKQGLFMRETCYLCFALICTVSVLLISQWLTALNCSYQTYQLIRQRYRLYLSRNRTNLSIYRTLIKLKGILWNVIISCFSLGNSCGIPREYNQKVNKNKLLAETII